MIAVEHSLRLDQKDLAEVRAALQEFGQVRIREMRPPAAGAHMLDILVTFVGTSAAAGLIGELAVSLFRRLAKKLTTPRNDAVTSFASSIDQVIVSFDDLDIFVGLPHPEGINKLPEILAEVRNRIGCSPPSTEPIHYVVLPVLRYFDKVWSWWSTSVSGPREYPYRYWLLDARIGFAEAPRIYDTFENRVWSVPPDEVLGPYRQLRNTRDYMVDPVASIITRLRPHLPQVVAQHYAGRVLNLASALQVRWPVDAVEADQMVERLLVLCEGADRGGVERILRLGGD